MTERTCSIEGCGRPAKVKGMCGAHYQRTRNGVDLSLPLRESGRTCDVDGCDRPHDAKGLCGTHASRARRGLPLDTPVKRMNTPSCEMDGCDRPHVAFGYCGAHLWRVKNDKPLDTPIRERINDREGCLVEGCEQPHAGRGYCAFHYKRTMNGRDLTMSNRRDGTAEDIGYTAAHARVRRLKGSASDYPCADCGGPAQDWAYSHSGVKERWELLPEQSAPSPYSTDPEQYDPRCRSCHRLFDAAHKDHATLTV